MEKKGLLPAVNGSGQAGTPISVIPGNDKQGNELIDIYDNG